MAAARRSLPAGSPTVRGKLGFATSEVQISETETPLHRLETVYRRLMERLSTVDTPQGAMQNIVDGWFYTLEEDVLAEGSVREGDVAQLIERTTALLEKRLAKINADCADVQRGAPELSSGPGRRTIRAPRRACLPGSRASRTFRPRRSVPPA